MRWNSNLELKNLKFPYEERKLTLTTIVASSCSEEKSSRLKQFIYLLIYNQTLIAAIMEKLNKFWDDNGTRKLVRFLI